MSDGILLFLIELFEFKKCQDSDELELRHSLL